MIRDSLTYDVVYRKSFGCDLAKPDRLKPVLLGSRRHIHDWRLLSLLRLLTVRRIRIGNIRIRTVWIGSVRIRAVWIGAIWIQAVWIDSVWISSIRIGCVWSASGIRVRICGRLPWHGNLPCWIPDEFPLLVGVASQINPHGRFFDFAADSDDVAAHDSSIQWLRLGFQRIRSGGRNWAGSESWRRQVMKMSWLGGSQWGRWRR